MGCRIECNWFCVAEGKDVKPTHQLKESVSTSALVCCCAYSRVGQSSKWVVENFVGDGQ